MNQHLLFHEQLENRGVASIRCKSFRYISLFVVNLFRQMQNVFFPIASIYIILRGYV
jgi:hypothetical protein